MPTGFHNVQPGQKCRILTIQIAVPADADPDIIADEMSAVLTGAIASDNSNVLDWRYAIEYQPEVTASDDPEEGEIFASPDNHVEVSIKISKRYPRLNKPQEQAQ